LKLGRLFNWKSIWS